MTMELYLDLQGITNFLKVLDLTFNKHKHYKIPHFIDYLIYIYYELSKSSVG